MEGDGSPDRVAAAPQVDHIAVPVDDVERAAAFYVELFDARPVPSPDFPVPVSWVLLGGVHLHLVQRPGHTSSAYHFALAITAREQFEELYRRADREDHFEHDAFGHHLYEGAGGVAQLYLRDPSGNVVECDYPDARALDADIAQSLRPWAGLPARARSEAALARETMRGPVGGLHHVGVVVADLDAAEALLTSAFGLPVTQRLASAELGMRAVFLNCGPVTVELVQFADPELARQRLRGGAAAIDHLALAVDDLETAVRALAAHGVATVSERPLLTPAGRTHFTRGDTSGGIAWQLIEPAARP